MAIVFTKLGTAIYASTTGGGAPRRISEAEAAVWCTEAETALNAHDAIIEKLFSGKVISAAYTVTSAEVYGVILATGNTLYSITVPAPASLGAPATITVKNASLRGKRIVANIDGGGSTTYMLYPGMSVGLVNVGTGSWIIMDDQRYRNLYGGSAGVSGSVKLRVKPSSGHDTDNDGLGDDAPLATMGKAKDIFYYQYDSAGNEGIIELMTGEVARENLIFDRVARGITQLYLQAANGGAIFAHNGGAGIQTRDSGIVTVRRAPGGSGTLRFASVDGADNPVNGGIGLYATQMSVIDTEDGVELGSYPNGWQISIDRADFNIKSSILISGGAAAAVRCQNGRITWQGSTTCTLSVNTNYPDFLDILDGASVVLGSSITFAGGMTHSGRRFQNRHCSRLYASGNTLPGTTAGSTDAATYAVTI